jgi:hypothetical protein
LTAALCSAAVSMTISMVVARRYPLRLGSQKEVTPWASDESLDVHESQLEAGPVAVEIDYRIRVGDAPAFLDAVGRLRSRRRRDGATFWRVYRELTDPDRYIERFLVSSYADYLRHQARATIADHELEAEVRAFDVRPTGNAVQLYIAER